LDNSERAQKHIAKLNTLKRTILPVVAFQKKVDDLGVMVELAETASPGEADAYTKELEGSVTAMGAELDGLEIASFLTGQFDRNNAIFSIQSGAGALRPTTGPIFYFACTALGGAARVCGGVAGRAAGRHGGHQQGDDTHQG